MAKLSVGKAMLQAKAHERRGELAEAQALYQAVIADYPGNRRAKDALGALKAPPKGLTRTDPSHEELARVIAVGRNKSAAEAISVATNLTRRFPASGVAANVLGGFLQSDERPDEAEAAFRRAIELNPDLADAYYNLGKLCRTLDRMDEAEAAYRRAIRIRPRYMEARRNLGNVLLDMGRMEDAATAFREAIETDPRHGSSHHGLSRATRYSPDHPHLAEMLALSDCDGLDDDARADLGFAIARAYEQIGDLELAAKYLAHGNAARRRQLDYRFETDENLFKLLTDCAAELTGIVAHSPRADFTPVFILGMPRSGTTLVEQIVGSHSDVTPGGELEYLGQWLTGPTLRKQRITQGFVAQLRAHYLQTVGRLGVGRG